MKIAAIFLLLVLAALHLLSCNNCRYGCVNGTCVRNECMCDIYWEGDACERSTLSEFEGTYRGTDSCEPDNDTLKFDLHAVYGKPGQMITSSQLKIAYSDSGRFEIPEQLYQGDTIVGEGQMILDGISMRYERIGEGSDPCLLVAFRQ